MYQIKLSDDQYRDLIFALCVAVNATKMEAWNLTELGVLDMSREASEDVNAYQNLREYITKNKEVL